MLLRSTLWGERDKLATLFVPHLGAIRARAVAAAQTDSKLGPFLIPPLLGTFTLAQGRSPVRILAAIEPEERFAAWRADSLHLKCAGVMMGALEGLDAPEQTNRQFLDLTASVLRRFTDKPLDGLAVFTVKTLHLLGLLGGETQCAVCGNENTTGTVAAPLDMSAFICRQCYNRIYGKKEVSVIFIQAKHLEIVRKISQAQVEDCPDIRLDSEAMAVLFSLAEFRLPEMLPGAALAMMRLVAGGA